MTSIKQVTIINSGTGYTGLPSDNFPEPTDQTRQKGQENCPKLGSVWRSYDGVNVTPIGWQGGYVNLILDQSPRIWTYEEFWDWARDNKAEMVR